jgi:hypothetical protein
MSFQRKDICRYSKVHVVRNDPDMSGINIADLLACCA